MKDKQKKYVRNDIILISVLSVIAIVLCIWIYTDRNDSLLKVEILVDGQLIESVMLGDDAKKEIVLDAGNAIVVKDGYVYMKSADCPDKLCVKQGKIHKNNQSIICLPHKVVVRLVPADGQIISGEDGLDVIPR